MDLTSKRASPFSSQIHRTSWLSLPAKVVVAEQRRQFPIGVTLLIAAPVLIVWIGVDYGWVVAVLALLAFLSMFRRPLMHFYTLARERVR